MPELACPWCHSEARDAAGPMFVCDAGDCPVSSFTAEEVPAHA